MLVADSVSVPPPLIVRPPVPVMAVVASVVCAPVVTRTAVGVPDVAAGWTSWRVAVGAVVLMPSRVFVVSTSIATEPPWSL